MVKIRPYLLDGPRSAGELTRAIGISRAGLRLAYEQEEESVLRFGRARGTQYAARQNFTGLSADEFPVFRVDEAGKIAAAGELVTLTGNQSIWCPHNTVLDGLPAEMNDMAPRGFLGRSFAGNHADLGLPDDLNNWSDHHVLIALSRRGEDLPGNLVIGRGSFDRFQRLQFKDLITDDFPALAQAALAGEHVGSSAGGERPKFTALLDGRHRLIKFATSESDNARRWQDLLVLEHVALKTLSDAGVQAAETDLIDVDGLRCLIINRFDRIGARGRRSVMTLAAASEEYAGSWTDAAQKLTRRDALSENDLRRIALLDAFGALIANTDRHKHNVVLFHDDGSYSLAPAFDQLPMAYAPPASGHLRRTAVDEAVPAVNTLEVWDEAREIAMEFWRRASDRQMTNSMRDIVREHARR